MFRHTQTKEQKALAERMRLALEREHNGYKTPLPNTVSEFRKETFRIPE
jgi:hypothetical protein